MPRKRSNIKSPFLTPEMLRLAREEQMARAMTELFKLHRDFMAKVDTIAGFVVEVRNEAMRIKKLPKGDKGDKGDIGPRGVPGRNGATVEEVLARVPTPKDGVTPDVEAIAALVMARLTVPKDGKDAIIDHEQVVKDVLELLKKDFDWRKIPGLENEMASYRNQLAGKVYGKNTWARGGGSSGGDTGVEVVGEVVAGSGTSFVLANVPTPGTVKLFAIGQRLTPIEDYTISGANITTVLPWDAGKILADYSHA